MNSSREGAAAILTRIVFQKNERLRHKLEQARAEIPYGYRSENLEHNENLAIDLVETTYRKIFGRLSRRGRPAVSRFVQQWCRPNRNAPVPAVTAS